MPTDQIIARLLAEQTTMLSYIAILLNSGLRSQPVSEEVLACLKRTTALKGLIGTTPASTTPEGQ